MDPNEPEVDPLIAGVYGEWVQEMLDTTSTNRARIHESLGRLYILPAIDNLRVSRLRNEQQVQNIINSAFKGSISGRQLSKRTSVDTESHYCGIP